MTDQMTTTTLETELAETLTAIIFADVETDTDLDATLNGAGLSTFGDAGILTTNNGLVLNLTDGTSFQITIVRSR